MVMAWIRRRESAGRIGLAVLAVLVTATGCSIKRLAINKLGDALAGSGTTFASDDDPELVGQAVPFSLKLIESLLDASPRHRGLLLAAAKGFTQYSYAWVQQEADSLADQDVARARAARDRARRLYFRARDYGLRGLETRHQRFAQLLRSDARSAIGVTTVQDVPLLYWTAAAWGAAIAISKESPDIVADQPLVEALIDRALALDERFDDGAIHGFLISYEQVRRGAAGDAVARSRGHFDRVVTLTNAQLASPFVSWAEAVSESQQDRVEFETMLRRALDVDPNARPEWRLTNLIMQRRARWLLSRVDDLFLDNPKGQP